MICRIFCITYLIIIIITPEGKQHITPSIVNYRGAYKPINYKSLVPT